VRGESEIIFSVDTDVLSSVQYNSFNSSRENKDYEWILNSNNSTLNHMIITDVLKKYCEDPEGFSIQVLYTIWLVIKRRISQRDVTIGRSGREWVSVCRRGDVLYRYMGIFKFTVYEDNE